MSNLLQQAQTAAQYENWSLLNQCLHQLLSDIEAEEAEPLPEITPVTTADSHLESMLDLALAVLEMGEFPDRWEVAKVFPGLGTVAISPLLTLLKDEEADPEARWFAARILGEFNDPAVITALIDLLKTSTDEELSGMAAEALAKLGTPAIAALTDLLNQEQTRPLAVRSLAQIRTAQTIEPLLQVIHDPQDTVRATAIEALSSFHDARIPPVLIQALNDSAVAVRSAAVAGLGFRADLLSDFDLVAVLEPLLFDLNLDVCQQCAIALGRLGTPAAATTLFRVFQSPTTPDALKLSIIQALGRIEHPDALVALQQGLQQQPSASLPISQEIINTLAQVQSPELKQQAVHILTNTLQAQTPATQLPEVRQTLALSLGQLGDRSTIDTLFSMLTDSDFGVKLHVIAALKALDSDVAYQRLQRLAADDTLSPALKEGVAIALQEWQVSSSPPTAS